MLWGNWRLTHHAFSLGLMTGLIAMFAMVLAGRIWGNTGSEAAGLVFIAGIVALTSWFRTRPERPDREAPRLPPLRGEAGMTPDLVHQLTIGLRCHAWGAV